MILVILMAPYDNAPTRLRHPGVVFAGLTPASGRQRATHHGPPPNVLAAAICTAPGALFGCFHLDGGPDDVGYPAIQRVRHGNALLS